MTIEVLAGFAFLVGFIRFYPFTIPWSHLCFVLFFLFFFISRYQWACHDLMRVWLFHSAKGFVFSFLLLFRSSHRHPLGALLLLLNFSILHFAYLPNAWSRPFSQYLCWYTCTTILYHIAAFISPQDFPLVPLGLLCCVWITLEVSLGMVLDDTPWLWCESVVVISQ